MNSIISINRQRVILEKKLSGEQEMLSTPLIESCMQDTGLLADEQTLILVHRFTVLARFLDNLLDDEGLDHRFLENEIKNPQFLYELQDFKDHLEPSIRTQFTNEGALAMRIMGMYQRSPSLKLRLMESRMLARLYSLLALPQSPHKKEFEESLYNLFTASYMFCDLKDFSKDNNCGSRLRMIAELLKTGLAYFRKVQHPVTIGAIIFRTCTKSLKNAFGNK